jgi:ElaA protein
MKTIIKRFDELTPMEIHDIYKARIDVFVVEQNCPYHEVDGFDPQSIHILLLDDNNTLKAYCRVLPARTTFDTPSIGRVIALERRKGYASIVLEAAINVIKEIFKENIVTIEAQTYARSLYEKQGFTQTSEPFLEDGIEHIQMQLHIS